MGLCERPGIFLLEVLFAGDASPEPAHDSVGIHNRNLIPHYERQMDRRKTTGQRRRRLVTVTKRFLLVRPVGICPA
jgi:hypothetical protein